MVDFWLPILLATNAIGTTVVAVVVFFWTRGQRTAIDNALLVRKVAELESRLERAGQKSSDLTDRVQVLASRHELVEAKEDTNRAHQLHVEQIAKLNVDIGKLYTAIARLDTWREEHSKAYGRREYDRD